MVRRICEKLSISISFEVSTGNKVPKHLEGKESTGTMKLAFLPLISIAFLLLFSFLLGKTLPKFVIRHIYQTPQPEGTRVGPSEKAASSDIPLTTNPVPSNLDSKESSVQ